MHLNNQKWIADLRAKYPKNFIGAKVLEIGSLDVNGSIREFFTDCKYVGVDVVEGTGVDVVTDNTRFHKKFDTLMIISVFEHDLKWKDTLKHNLRWLKDGGMCFVTFGAEGNKPHMEVWKPVPHQEFLDYCKEIGVQVIDSFWEEERYGRGDAGVFNAILKK